MYILLAVNIILLVFGQTIWKIGLDRLGGLQTENILQVVLSPFILVGIVCYGIATILWLAVISKLPLSVAYPLQSLAYVLGVGVAFLYFHEVIPIQRWIGVLIIIIGVSVLSWK